MEIFRGRELRRDGIAGACLPALPLSRLLAFCPASHYINETDLD